VVHDGHDYFPLEGDDYNEAVLEEMVLLSYGEVEDQILVVEV